MGKTAFEELMDEESARYDQLAGAVMPLLEPVVAEGAENLDLASRLSIAISLKRIADEVCGGQERLSLVNGVMHAIEQGILSARG